MPGAGAPGPGMRGAGVPGAGAPGPGAPGPGAPGPGTPGAGRHGYPGRGAGPSGYRGRGAPPRSRRTQGPPGQGPIGQRLHGEGLLGHGTQGEVPAPQLSGNLITQRNTALPEREIGGTQPLAAIAPDGLDSFARDLRALRAKAELDYPEMAEKSHYTMKTLASAAGGLRLPTLPVAMAYVKACGGEESEWEDRWHKLAEKITAEAIKKQGGEGEAPPEPSDPPQSPGPQASSSQPPPDDGEIYVITSAKPRG